MAEAEARSNALAPSAFWLASAAVILPLSRKGLSEAIFSRLVRRGHSSRSTPATGTISEEKSAVNARSWLPNA